MNQLVAALQLAAADVTRFGRAWALVGGFAVSARAQPRFTRDIDIAVAVGDDTAAEGRVRDLMGAGYQLFATMTAISSRH